MSPHHVLAIGDDLEAIEAWIAALPLASKREEDAHRAVLWFHELGPVRMRERTVLDDPGEGQVIERDWSPLLEIIKPRRPRPYLWTDCRIQFTPSPMKMFPKLQRAQKDFVAWLAQFELVHDTAIAGGRWDYWLEAGLRSSARVVHALPQAMAALSAGQYFVSLRDNDAVLDKLGRTLALRGVDVRCAS